MLVLILTAPEKMGAPFRVFSEASGVRTPLHQGTQVDDSHKRLAAAARVLYSDSCSLFLCGSGRRGDT